MTVAYSFVRYSHASQRQGDSVRRQMKLSEDYCQRHGLTLDKSLTLEKSLTISAFRGKQRTIGGLSEFLSMIKDGKVAKGTILIVESLDRISREDVGTEALPLFLNIINAGVTIVTLNPEQRHTRTTISTLEGLLIPIVTLARANEESSTKSVRIAAAWKQNRLKHPRFTNIVPSWIVKGVKGEAYSVDAVKAATIVKIFEMANDGKGCELIAKKLNHDGVPTIAKSPTWKKVSIAKLLRNRNVIGEFTPRSFSEDGSRVAACEPIVDFYPKIVDVDLFYAVQDKLNERKAVMVKNGHQPFRGRAGKTVASLFTGLIFDARDRLPMQIFNKGNGLRLASSGRKEGLTSSTPYSYDLIEQHFLFFVKELKPSDFLPQKERENANVIGLLSGKLAGIIHQIDLIGKQLTDWSKDGLNSVKLLEVLGKLEVEKKAISSELEAAKRTLTSSSLAEVLGETISLIGMLENAVGEDLFALRMKIKSRIRQLVESIWFISFNGIRRSDGLIPFKGAEMQVFFKNGKYRSIMIDEHGACGSDKALTFNGVRDLRKYGEPPFGRWFD